ILGDVCIAGNHHGGHVILCLHGITQRLDQNDAITAMWQMIHLTQVVKVAIISLAPMLHLSELSSLGFCVAIADIYPDTIALHLGPSWANDVYRELEIMDTATLAIEASEIRLENFRGGGGGGERERDWHTLLTITQ
ncbi:hypothetical protein ACJX0J_022824, partial [Zea mays]